VSCVSELRGLGAIQPEIAELGGSIVALSSDTPEQARKMAEKHRLGFPILCDPSCEVIKQYGLLHAGGNPDGKDTAVPAHLLIDVDGRIAWRYVSGRITDRPDPQDDVAALRALRGRVSAEPS